jgi:predicted Zn-dependent peptidase
VRTPGVRTHRLSNGLTIIGESLADKRAAAWTFLVAAGAATEPAALDGLTSVLESVSYRGAVSADGTGARQPRPQRCTRRPGH